MAGRVFLDTNVLVYAEDARDGAKCKQARSIIEQAISSGEAVVSTQVLQELFSVATKKLGIAATVARGLVEDYSKLDVVLVRPELILGAIDLHRVHSVSFWDALVIRSASAASCDRLLSEDLQHGRTIDGVLIENPFLPATRAGEQRAGYGAGRSSKRPRRDRPSLG